MPELPEEIWIAAASEFKKTGWFSEYSNTSFYMKSINRKFSDIIKEKLSSLSGIDQDSIEYTEHNLRGANGWVFYDSTSFSLEKVEQILEKEIKKANF